jgi:hypothetical protein
MVQVLNKARLYDEIQAHAAAKGRTAAEDAKPDAGAETSAARDPSRLSTAEWMRWRATQLRKRN